MSWTTAATVILLTTSCGIQPQATRKTERTHQLQPEDGADSLPADTTPDEVEPVQPDEQTPDPVDDDPVDDGSDENDNVDDNQDDDLPTEDWGEWHSLFFTGDNEIWAFDNARDELSSLLKNAGFSEANMSQLTKMTSLINQGIPAANKLSIRRALAKIEPQEKDLCFVHMSSHGSRSAFYLKGESGLTPKQLDEMLDIKCGNHPTVVMVSACYSGIFSDNQDMRQANRIIFTAARKDRTSFGCSPENEYTFWDGCLIDHLPSSRSWKRLYQNIQACIARKEKAGNYRASYPQLFMGEEAKNYPYPFNP